MVSMLLEFLLMGLFYSRLIREYKMTLVILSKEFIELIFDFILCYIMYIV